MIGNSQAKSPFSLDCYLSGCPSSPVPHPLQPAPKVRKIQFKVEKCASSGSWAKVILFND
jgi:hypothetical protein